jgi:hypothetical protein
LNGERERIERLWQTAGSSRAFKGIERLWQTARSSRGSVAAFDRIEQSLIIVLSTTLFLPVIPSL